MKVFEKSDKIVFWDMPFGKWLNGLLILSFGVICLCLYMSDAIKEPVYTFGLQKSFFTIGSYTLFFLFMIVVSVIMIALGLSELFAPMMITKINLNKQIVAVTVIKLLFIKHIQRYCFSQILSFEMKIEPTKNIDYFYNYLVLANGAQIDLETSGSRKDKTGELRARLNKTIKESKSSPRL